MRGDRGPGHTGGPERGGFAKGGRLGAPTNSRRRASVARGALRTWPRPPSVPSGGSPEALEARDCHSSRTRLVKSADEYRHL